MQGAELGGLLDGGVDGDGGGFGGPDDGGYQFSSTGEEVRSFVLQSWLCHFLMFFVHGMLQIGFVLFCWCLLLLE
jgi:hypothetical protein